VTDRFPLDPMRASASAPPRDVSKLSEAMKTTNPASTAKPVARHAEHPGGPVTVPEIASLRRAASHQEHRRDCEGGHSDDDA
jgi:hypothetical protein